jgi:hypothetical protein
MKFARLGRPLKYKAFLEALEDDTVYTPATIVQLGLAKGLFPNSLNQEQLKESKLRVRHTLSRFSSNHEFPFKGDGFATIEGQPPLRGWYGFRWKMAADIPTPATQIVVH